MPRTIVVGAPTQTIQVVGTNFGDQPVILWNGSAVLTKVVNASTLSGTVDSIALATPSTAQVQVLDSSYMQRSQAVPVTVASPSTATQGLAITTAALGTGATNSTYSQALQAIGGTPGYTWTITSGHLPAGLALTPSTGLITGVPTTPGSGTFTITVADSSTPVQTQSNVYSIVIGNLPLAITSSTLSAAISGTAYSQTLQASGGTPAYNWTVSSGNLPAGLTLASNGTISGAPTVSGTFSFTATVTDSGSPAQSKSATTSIVVGSTSTPLNITSSSLASATINSSYSQTLQASGGTPGYSWTISSGSLPTGLTLASNGTISGTPTVSGTFNLTVTVTDSSSPVQSRSAITSIVVGATSLTITSSSFVAATLGTPYSQTLQASGGTSAYTWSVSNGNLPTGLTLAPATGVISGTATATGTYPFTVSVTDSSSPAQTKSVATSLTVGAGGLSIAQPSFAAAAVGAAYSQTLQASGGTPGYNWTITNGNLPGGLSLASNGVISGTPTASGTFSFTATVTDSSSPVQSKSVSTSISVSGSSLAINSSALAAATSGTTYSQTLLASGGTPGYSWTITNGNLPGGLTFASNGVISGTPTATGTFNFTVTVTDSSSPTQSKSANTSIVVSGATASLKITSSAFVSGTNGTAFSQTLTASGGTPAYNWTITSGSLPPGLTLAATSGVVSGTPTVTGTSNFTVTVTDNSTPAQTASATTSIVVAAPAPTGPGTTWYIRPDGGTRYSSNVVNGQCDGKSDSPYLGSGTNQHCAFSDYRYLWDDQSYNNKAWVISGGDTVILRGGPWRIGWDSNTGPGAGYTWCFGADNIGCTNPTVPAGTATQHTRILGENFGACSATNKTQIFGGYGVYTALNLSGAQYVDVECMEITRHSNCIFFGSPASPASCNHGNPTTASLDDYDSDGVRTDANTHDLLLQDMWIHGHLGRGVKGPIGAKVTCLRCVIAFNGGAGWDFDDGSGPASVFGPDASWSFLYSTIEWNGCNQEYPAVHTVPVASCYSQSTGGYGDGVGTPAGTGTGMSVVVDHSIFRYNTQDGIDLGHMDGWGNQSSGVNTLLINDSAAYGNNGGQFKWGAYFQPAVFTNNLAVANCFRLKAPFPGAPSNYNTNLSDFCRAQDATPFDVLDNGTVLFANNTVVSYAPTTYDVACWSASCTGSVITFENNITLGYDNPATYNQGGQVGGPGDFYLQNPIGTIIRNHNVWFGMRNIHPSNCLPGEVCLDPQFVNEPSGNGAGFVESELDNFNFNPTPASPTIGGGVAIPSITVDYNGTARPNPPAIGAIE